MNPTSAAELLLVEDNDDDAELTLRALRKHKVTNAVHRVTDGADALDFVLARGAYAGRVGMLPPQVILLDLKLPKLNGLEVLRILKADPKLKTIPVVMMTSSREDRDLKEAYALGVNSYVVKPVEFDQFAQAVAQLGMYWTLLNARPTPGGR